MQPNLQKFLICFPQGFEKPMCGNYKSLMIWAGGNPQFLGFLGLTLSHRIWKSSVLWNYELKPFFFQLYGPGPLKGFLNKEGCICSY